jgi:predicted O-methyltransferase YrrM
MSWALLPPAIEQYLEATLPAEPDIERRLRAETLELPGGFMLTDRVTGSFLALLARLVDARLVVEIGTFTGYSALRVASALPAGGRLVCCDLSEEWTAIARRYWGEAGVAGLIDLRLAPAQETLELLVDELGPGSVDLAFVDADKPSYDTYYESCLRLLRAGGLMVLDDMLWDGQVAVPGCQDPETVALRSLSAKIRGDDRVDACLLAVGEGLMLARKRGPADGRSASGPSPAN